MIVIEGLMSGTITPAVEANVSKESETDSDGSTSDGKLKETVLKNVILK